MHGLSVISVKISVWKQEELRKEYSTMQIFYKMVTRFFEKLVDKFGITHEILHRYIWQYSFWWLVQSPPQQFEIEKKTILDHDVSFFIELYKNVIILQKPNTGKQKKIYEKKKSVDCFIWQCFRSIRLKPKQKTQKEN